MTDMEYNILMAEGLMLAWFDIFGMLQCEGDPQTDYALENFRTWNTIFRTLEAM